MTRSDPFDRTDVVRLADLERLAATLDVPSPVQTPALWHWTSFLDRSPTSTLGPDGHPRSGGLIPDPPHPRRMFAGGRMRIDEPFPTDVPIRRRAEVGPVVHKSGSLGPLALVTVNFDYLVDGRSIAQEEHDIVYLPNPDTETSKPPTAARPPEPTPVAVTAGRSTEDVPGEEPGISVTTSFNEPALFRFSALTFNAHRIHYDRRYAIETEGHQDLVVHGPLLVIRLLDLVRAERGDAAVAELSFRLKAPTYVGRPITFAASLSDADATLVARDGDRVLMEAAVKLR
jgi:hydroxyacyl-ACP dehydratase HTD2-like protein with hotdog domain